MIEEGGVITRAADKLHIKRQTLQHKLKKYKMQQTQGFKQFYFMALAVGNVNANVDTISTKAIANV